MPQTDRLGDAGGADGKEGLRYDRCNIYRTPVDGNVSEVGDRDGPMFWDRGCGELLSVSLLAIFFYSCFWKSREGEMRIELTW